MRVAKHPYRKYVCKTQNCPNYGVEVRTPAIVARTLHRGYDEKGNSKGTGTFWKWDELWCECGTQPELVADTLSPVTTR